MGHKLEAADLPLRKPRADRRAPGKGRCPGRGSQRSVRLTETRESFAEHRERLALVEGQQPLGRLAARHRPEVAEQIGPGAGECFPSAEVGQLGDLG